MAKEWIVDDVVMGQAVVTPERETVITIRDAAVLALARGCTLVETRPDGYGVAFVFDDRDGTARRALNEWYTRTATVNAYRFSQAAHTLREVLRGTPHRFSEPVNLVFEKEPQYGQGSRHVA